jgi:pyruvate formate lyase activating enzyme
VNGANPEGRFCEAEGEGCRCTLCPHRCFIRPGGSGLCAVRRLNRAYPGPPAKAALELPYYGCITALAEDPIEKKPLFHWRPGSGILSAGFAGCNLRCPFCQNWRISQISPADGGAAPVPPVSGRRLSPEALAALAADSPSGGAQIAYTYSEPLVHAEYLLACMEAARQRGIANVLVTNGCVNLKAAGEILALTDAANIDLKSFSEETYDRVLGGSLPAALDFIRLAVSLGVHVEITTLVTPGLNDGDAELEEAARFIADLSGEIPWTLAGGNGVPGAEKRGPSIPWHLSACHPDWNWNGPPTNPARLLAAVERARTILPHVYTGNIPGEPEDTSCPHCGAVLVKRRGYQVDASGLGEPLPSGTRDAAFGGGPAGGNRRALFYRCAACWGTTPIRA